MSTIDYNSIVPVVTLHNTTDQFSDNGDSYYSKFYHLSETCYPTHNE